ncbi:hypothetical protein PV328_009350 [Microctonus aethiopoides]|uniref:Uncharacterized protein n=1 Tax=Microctonus aethiopoides TaxID=144406 RepID=A0AA39C5L9_9HYME|nr:hypothetical protein PV328_009350 [Microctonus aethiopoides]
MIDMMAEDWKAPRVIEERQAMLITAKISHKISVASTILTSTLFVAYIIFRMWVGLEMNKRTDLDPRLSIGLPHPAYFPYDTKKLEYFLPTWIAQCITTFFCMTAYATFDTFISTMILHICGQLRVVGISLKNLVNEKNQRDSNAFLKKFSTLIKRHEKLNHTFLSQTYYESNWYNLPAHQSKWLMFVGHRSQKPLILSAGKFCTFSIHLFIVVLKTSVGYLSMLLTVKQRKMSHTM